MLSKACVYKGMRWRSPISIQRVSWSHASGCASVVFGSSTAKGAKCICVTYTSTAASTRPLWAASNPGTLSVQRLRAVFDEVSDGDLDRMGPFLQGKIGIRNRRCCPRTVSHLASIRQKSSHFQTHNQQKIVTLCVEGNISSGKSTFLHELREGSLDLKEDIKVVPEPVDKWQKVQASNGSMSVNLLDAFYRDPHRFAYTFQNYVFLTRLVQAKESEDCGASLRLMERSIFSDRMVFVRAAHEAKWLSEMELSIYESWFDPVLAGFEGLVPDGFIYLAASPETCLRRLTFRGRDEEVGVSLQYLDNLHAKHEEWLHTGLSRANVGYYSDASMLEDRPSLSGPNKRPDILPYAASQEPESIRGRVFYLSQETQPLLSKHLDGLPALYLDCDKDIDFERDQAAKDTIARHVQDFTNHVRVLREAR